MTLRERILEALMEAKGNFVSGEKLALRFGVSRAAVWKTVNALRKEAYEVEAVPKKGYRLAGNDVLSPEGILSQLKTVFPFRPVCRRVVTSTNTVLKEMAAAGAEEGTVLLAEEQTEGRGRLGRSFYSPFGSGLYMSILLMPEQLPSKAARLTTMAACAAALAIEELTGRDVGIKWVNDLYMDGKKVCGILTEASMSLESGRLERAVVGIGVNLREPEGGFPPELRSIVGAVWGADCGETNLRNTLAARILDRFAEYYLHPDSDDCYLTYKQRSFLLGKEINILHPDGSHSPATALSVDRNYRLVVRLADGREALLNSGEVSVRPQQPN